MYFAVRKLILFCQFIGVPQWEFRAELQRGRYPGEVSDRKALHDSKVVVLEFDTGQLRVSFLI